MPTKRSLRPGSRPRRRRDHDRDRRLSEAHTRRVGDNPPEIPLPGRPGTPSRYTARGQSKPRVQEKGFFGVVCRPCRDPYRAFQPRKGAPRIVPAESAEKSSDLGIFYSSLGGAFSPKKDAVHARNSPRRGLRAPKTGKELLQCPRNGSFREPLHP
jgi:hypothetical protein